MPRHHLRLAALTVAAFGALAVPAQAAPFANGSFELSDGPPRSTTVSAGQRIIPGWDVVVDRVTWTYQIDSAPATDGDRSIVMSPRYPEVAIQQTFDTVTGASYRVSYDVATPKGCQADYDPVGNVQAGATARGTYTAHADAARRTYDFVAGGPTTTLRFDGSAYERGCGIVLDAVDVQPLAPATLDSRAATRATMPVFESATTLTAGVRYTVGIRGTSSSWHPTIMGPGGQRARNWVVCGAPEDGPQIASPGAPNGRVGEDPAFLFALPQTGTRCNPRFATLLPLRSSGLRFDLDGSGDFATVPAPVGDPAAPTPDHGYTFTVVGHDQPLRVRFADRSPADNSGQYAIAVTRAAPVRP